jgi:5,10-methenyltetrahydromethanopterin hydrogenase
VNIDLASFLTPDGRWDLLQDWLDEHPRNKAKLDAWLGQTPDQVFPQLREVVAEIATKKYGPLAGALARTTTLTPEISKWIVELQTLYKEREAEDVRTRRTARESKAIRG